MKPSSSLVLLFVLSLALPPYIAALDPDLRGDPPAIRASDMEVLPKGDTTSTMAYKAENSVMFEFYMASIGNYDVACLSSGTVTDCTPDPSLIEDYLPTMGSEPTGHVFATYAVAGPGTGEVRIRVTHVSCGGVWSGCLHRDEGYFNVDVDPPVAMIEPQVTSRLLIPGAAAGLPAGPATEFRPHELSARHRFPGYVTMDTERALTLVYSSRSADPTIIVPFDATLQTATPDSLSAWLTVNGTAGTKVSFSTAGWSDGETRRLALAFDASALATGSYGYTIALRSKYGGNVYDSEVHGRLGVLNDASSPYGRGWRLAGVQRLHETGDTVMVAGCACSNDAHSYAVFLPFGSGNYSAPDGEHSTLERTLDGSTHTGWKREMKDGVKHFFDLNGRQLSTVDRNDQETTYEYDGSGNLIKITDPMEWETVLSYSGSEVTISIPSGRTAKLTLSSDRLTKITDPDSSTVLFGYDGSERLNSRTSKRGEVTTYTYDSHGLPASSTLPISAGRSYASPLGAAVADYPSEGTVSNPKAVTTAEQVVGSYTDARGSTWGLGVHATLAMTFWETPYNDTTTWARNSSASPTARILPNGRRTNYAYDSEGNLTDIEELETGAHWQLGYGAYSQLVEIIYPDSSIYSVAYDGNGNPTTVQTLMHEPAEPEPEVTSESSMTYNAEGQVVTMSSYVDGDPILVREAEYLPASGNKEYEIQHRDSVTADTIHFTYDASGRLKEVIDGRGGKVEFVYDVMNRTIERIDQLSNSESWQYDVAGMDSVWTNRRGQSVTYSYDALGRMTGKVADQTSVFQYDAEGNLTRGYNSDSDIYIYYDAMGRDTANTQNGKRVSYRYQDGMLDRKTMRDPDGGVHTYTVDYMSQVTEIEDPEALVTIFDYDPMNRRTKRTQANDVVTDYTYTPTSKLARIIASHGSSVYLDFDYGYDDAGRRTSWMRETNEEHTFQYDQQGQLLDSEIRNGSGTLLESDTHSYDDANNIRGASAGKFNFANSHDAANRLIKAGTDSLHYDLDGNLVTEEDGASTYTYAYDREGRLVSQSGPGLTISYKYDVFGRRIEENVNSTVTKYVYDGIHVLMDLDGSGTTVARYTHGPNIDEVVSVRRSGSTYYYLQDGLGSVVKILNASRSTVNSYEYLPWGETRAASETIENRFRFTGREMNADGRTMHYRAREYLPHLARFGQEDPLGFVDGVNLYAYVGNSPCDFVDPLGLCSMPGRTTLLAGAMGGVGAGFSASVANGSQWATFGFVAGGAMGSTAAGIGAIPGAAVGAIVGFARGFLAGVGASAISGAGTAGLLHVAASCALGDNAN